MVHFAGENVVLIGELCMVSPQFVPMAREMQVGRNTKLSELPLSNTSECKIPFDFQISQNSSLVNEDDNTVIISALRI